MKTILVFIHTSALKKACSDGDTEKVTEILNNDEVSMMCGSETCLEVAVECGKK